MLCRSFSFRSCLVEVLVGLGLIKVWFVIGMLCLDRKGWDRMFLLMGCVLVNVKVIFVEVKLILWL